MINVCAGFTGKLLQTLENSSFHKTCYLEAKTNVLPIFAFGTVILTFLKFGHDKRFLLFLLENCWKDCKIAVFIKRVI